MPTTPTHSQSQAALQAFLHAATEREAQRLLDILLDRHAKPIIQAVLRRKLGHSGSSSDAYRGGKNQDEQDAEEVQSDICIHVIQRLRQTRASPEAIPIAHFDNYAAATAYNAVNMYLRKRYPRRYSLQNKLRFLLTHHADLALWQADGAGWTGGLHAWQSRASEKESDRLRALREEPLSAFARLLPGKSAPHMELAALLIALFRWVDQPVGLDDLVQIVAQLWGVKDARPEPPPEDGDDLPPGGPQDPTLGEQIARLDIKRYWEEITRLGPKQCAALLLEASDPNGNSLMELLELEGVANLRQMAAAMELPCEVVSELWNELPLPDARIGRILSVSTQHVTRLRLNARKRLDAAMRAT